MKHRVPDHRSIFQRAIRAIAKVLDEARRGRPAAVVCLAVLAMGVACLTAVALTHGWAWMNGSGAAGAFGWWPAQSVRAQGSGGTFTIIDVPGAGTGMLHGTTGIGINARGEVVGTYTTTPNVAHGFVRAADGTISTFDAPNSGTALNEGTFAIGIDAGGDVAGMSSDANNAYHGFVRVANGTMTEFDVSGAPTSTKHRGTIPMSINTGGDTAGFYVDTGAVRHGFARAANGTVTTFDVASAGTTSTLGTIPLSINAGGEITGFYIDANRVFHGFLRAANGTITAPIDAPGASTTPSKKGFSFSGTLADSIDTAGDVAGIYTDVNGVHHGFLRAANGAITAPIDAPGAGTAGVFPGTLPASTSAAGNIAGVYEDANGLNHGFLRAADGTMTAPIDAPGATTGMIGFFPGGTVSTGVNDSGAITGGFFDVNGVGHGFLFTPAITLPPAAAPTFNPPAGTYTSAQSVALADTTPGAIMLWTTGAGAPNNPYNGPIPVPATETIRAIAKATGFSDSAVASATYTINLPTPDFQVSVNPTTLTIVAGNNGQATFTVTPVNGFNSNISFACSGLPAEAECKFNPTSVTPSGAAASTMLTVSTVKAGAAMRAAAPSIQRPIYALLIASLAMILGVAARRKKVLRSLQFLGLLLLVMAASGLSSCSGGSGGRNPGTPLGTKAVSVSASTSGGSAINHAATLTITITQ